MASSHDDEDTPDLPSANRTIQDKHRGHPGSSAAAAADDNNTLDNTVCY
jgi:hypothetical protein